MNIWLTDPDTNKQSPQLTVFVIGAGICLAKLVVSGVIIGSFKISAFSGTDFAAAIGALGAIYSLHTHVNNLNDQKKES